MDRQVIEQKLESLRRSLVRIRERTPDTAAELEQDPDAQDVLTSPRRFHGIRRRHREFHGRAAAQA